MKHKCRVYTTGWNFEILYLQKESLIENLWYLWSNIYHRPLCENIQSHCFCKKPYHRCRSSPPGLFFGNGVLKICRKFTGEHPCRSVISETHLEDCFCTVCNFQSINIPLELNSLVISPGLLYHLIRRDTVRLANEALRQILLFLRNDSLAV